MKVNISSNKSNKFEAWVNKTSRLDVSDIMKSEGASTVQTLASLTPKDTGKTASSWISKVSTKGRQKTLTIGNTNTTKTGVPVVVLIRNGHGTGTGGYVRPNDFVTKPLEDMAKRVSAKIDRRIRNNG